MNNKEFFWSAENGVYHYGYMEGNTHHCKITIFTEPDNTFLLAIFGSNFWFKELSTAKQVGELIYKG